jgi:A/G-specific adenine glycosylase
MMLHRGAKVVVECHGGHVPKSVEQLRTIPGIGRYTAGALASIAFDLPEPLVDGNVARVLARLDCVEDPASQSPDHPAMWTRVAEILRCGSPRVLAQALMELGATVCLPRDPLCDDPCVPAVRFVPAVWPTGRAERRRFRLFGGAAKR